MAVRRVKVKSPVQKTRLQPGQEGRTTAIARASREERMNRGTAPPKPPYTGPPPQGVPESMRPLALEQAKRAFSPYAGRTTPNQVPVSQATMRALAGQKAQDSAREMEKGRIHLAGYGKTRPLPDVRRTKRGSYRPN